MDRARAPRGDGHGQQRARARRRAGRPARRARADRARLRDLGVLARARGQRQARAGSTASAARTSSARDAARATSPRGSATSIWSTRRPARRACRSRRSACSAPTACSCSPACPGARRRSSSTADTLMRNLVLKNQLVFGTVNAGSDAFAAAARDLATFAARWAAPLRAADHGAVRTEGRARAAHRLHRRIKNVVSFALMDTDPERERLEEDARRVHNWRRWGPYLADRQWGTVREDYSATGECWDYFPHDHARSRAYRWGEDGLLGICDRECRLCFALALWNGKDPILKERLFGLTGPEGNHGEDVKELYYYLDATPTFSYRKALYKYPQAEFPYARLVEENRRRGKGDREFELEDTGVFDDGATSTSSSSTRKAERRRPADPHHGRQPRPRGGDAPPAAARCGCATPGRGAATARATIRRARSRATAGRRAHRAADARPLPVRRRGARRDSLFTDNETNSQRLCGCPSASTYTKDAFHRRVVARRGRARSTPACDGTKAPRGTCSTCRRGGQQRACACGCARSRRPARVRATSTRSSSSASPRPTTTTRLARNAPMTERGARGRPPGRRRPRVVAQVLSLHRRALARRRSGAAAAARRRASTAATAAGSTCGRAT